MSPRPQAADRLRRVLAIVPYILEHGEATIGELSEVFGVAEKEIEADLHVLPFCGLAPYTPDRLIDVALIGDHVSIRFAEYFERPLRLTASEGFALLAAGRALLEVPGTEVRGPLASALDKLEDALGAHEIVDIDMGTPASVDELRIAADERERIELDYYSFGRDAMTTRIVEPYSVVSLTGQWYLAAYCHQAQDDRMFRVDRIHGLRHTGETFEPREQGAPADNFSPSPEDTRVVLDLPQTARWVVETYPVESVDEKRGRLRVELVVAERPWLERILLRIGPQAKVMTPKEWRDVGADAARRVLNRY